MHGLIMKINIYENKKLYWLCCKQLDKLKQLHNLICISNNKFCWQLFRSTGICKHLFVHFLAWKSKNAFNFSKCIVCISEIYYYFYSKTLTNFPG